MTPHVLVWSVVLLVAVGVMSLPVLRRRFPRTCWYLLDFPLMVARVALSWRALMVACDLTTVRRPPRALVGDIQVSGRSLRPLVPRPGWPRPMRHGLVLTVRLLAGQTPEQYVKASGAMGHAWRAHAVRVDSPAPGLVRLTVLARDPLTLTASGGDPRLSVSDLLPAQRRGADVPVVGLGVLRLEVGAREDGRAWVIDLGAIPHWLITGATRSGKSTLLTACLTRLMPAPVALVGIDCKGGMEFGPFAPRLSGLACSRAEAVGLLETLVGLTLDRMAACRTAGVRSVWELPENLRPVPVVVAVDEVAELFLAVDKAGRNEAARAVTALVRLAQLGAALGVHLLVAGQRVGSDLGTGVTALRAQLGGRVCHRVSDPETAVMTLGDVFPDAVNAALLIGAHERGVAITTDDATWLRARSVPVADPEGIAAHCASLTPALLDIPLPAAVVGGGVA